MEPCVKTTRKVYGEDGHFLTVEPWAESDCDVCICAEGEYNQSFYGNVDVVLSPKLARKLAEALICCANEVENEVKND